MTFLSIYIRRINKLNIIKLKSISIRTRRLSLETYWGNDEVLQTDL